MAYGFVVRNGQGEVILDQNTPVMCQTNDTQNVSPTSGSSWLNNGYRPNVSNHPYFSFRVTSSMNRIELVNNVGVNFGNPGNYLLPSHVFFNNKSNLGTIPFRMLDSSEVVDPENNDYGLITFDQNGNRLYHHSSKMLKVDSVFRLNAGNTVTIPNNRWLCCLVVNCIDITPHSIDYGRLVRQGSTNVWKVEWHARPGAFYGVFAYYTSS